jgi:hypothetical protein
MAFCAQPSLANALISAGSQKLSHVGTPLPAAVVGRGTGPASRCAMVEAEIVRFPDAAERLMSAFFRSVFVEVRLRHVANILGDYASIFRIERNVLDGEFGAANLR